MALERECDIFLYELSELCEHDGFFSVHGASYGDIMDLRKSVGENKIIKNNFGTIICILHVDGYIEKSLRLDGNQNNCIGYKITPKGIAFLATTSYEKQKKNDDLLLNLTIANGKIQSNLLYINRWIAFAGLVAAVYYLIEIMHFVLAKRHSQFSIYQMTAFVVFLFGMIAGIIIYMLISEGLSRKKSR